MKKPTKKILIERSTVLWIHDFPHGKIPIKEFINWIDVKTKSNCFDINISLTSDYDNDGSVSSTLIELSWQEKVKNLNYERDMKKYKKFLDKKVKNEIKKTKT